MRALPVPQDTVDLLVTAVLISSTDITQSPARLPIITPGRAPETVLAGADRIGQYVGLGRAVDEWTREVGFRTTLAVEAARKTLDVGDR